MTEISKGRKIIITDDMLGELTGGGTEKIIKDWLNNGANANVVEKVGIKLTVDDYDEVLDDLLSQSKIQNRLVSKDLTEVDVRNLIDQGDINGLKNALGESADLSMTKVAALNPAQKFYFVSNDNYFLGGTDGVDGSGNRKFTGLDVGDTDSLSFRQLLNTEFENGRISKTSMKSYVENALQSVDSIPEGLRNILYSSDQVEKFNIESVRAANGGELPQSRAHFIKAGFTEGAQKVIKGLPLVGDVVGVLLLSAGVAQAQDAEGPKAATERLLVVYAFEEYGGVIGGALGLALGLTSGPGAILTTILGSIAGSLGGAALGGLVYDTYSGVFGFISEIVEEAADISASQDVSLLEAIGFGVLSVFGFDGETVEGSDETDLMLVLGDGERFGGDGDDVLIAIKPEYHFKDELIDPDAPAPAEGEPDTRERYLADTGVVLDGGKGNDNLISLGGAGATLIGGEGQDLLFSFGTEAAKLYGNALDAAANQTSEAESDMFWWSPGAFIMDADPVDFISLFGYPLVGGSNFWAADYAVDSTFWFNWYGASESGQLVIINAIYAQVKFALDAVADKVTTIRDVSTIVQDYNYADHFGAQQDDYGIAQGGLSGRLAGKGDLGLRFRIYGADDGEEVSRWNAFWGEVIFYLDQFETFVASLHWRSDMDPLLIDLDGDGIETIALSSSGAYFDHDDDFFAERSGWVGSDDGIIAIDLNNDGLIDDISELFGGNNAFGELQRGFAALSDLDGNADGVIDAQDAAYGDIRVWRDLDGDGRGEAAEGELFTLEELGITSLGTQGTDFTSESGSAVGDTDAGRVLASGTTLLASGTYTRGDGTTGNLFEAIFETDTTRTKYRGDNGLISSALRIEGGESDGVEVSATGRGRSTTLAVAASNDLELADLLASDLAGMTTPDLVLLREQSGDIISRWAAADPLSRELTPIFFSEDGAQTLDYGV